MNTLKIILAILVMGAIIFTAILGICTIIASVRLFKNKEYSEGCLALFATAVLGLMIVMEVLYWLP